MHVRRLEVRILAPEVRQDWEFLKKREDNLSVLWALLGTVLCQTDENFAFIKIQVVRHGSQCQLYLYSTFKTTWLKLLM